MKLVEKLAEQARVGGVHLDPATAHEEGFISGFRKALEFAAGQCAAYAERNATGQFDAGNRGMYSACHRVAGENLQREINVLADQEVE